MLPNFSVRKLFSYFIFSYPVFGFAYFTEHSGYSLSRFRRVSECAVTAILYISFDYSEIAAAFIAERIERTITEQTVELVHILTAMAREVFTGSVLKECRTVFHKITLRISVLSARAFLRTALKERTGRRSLKLRKASYEVSPQPARKDTAPR